MGESVIDLKAVNGTWRRQRDVETQHRVSQANLEKNALKIV
jgi:hypothetical protein